MSYLLGLTQSNSLCKFFRSWLLWLVTDIFFRFSLVLPLQFHWVLVAGSSEWSYIAQSSTWVLCRFSWRELSLTRVPQHIRQHDRRFKKISWFAHWYDLIFGSACGFPCMLIAWHLMIVGHPSVPHRIYEHTCLFQSSWDISRVHCSPEKITAIE